MLSENYSRDEKINMNDIMILSFLLFMLCLRYTHIRVYLIIIMILEYMVNNFWKRLVDSIYEPKFEHYNECFDRMFNTTVIVWFSIPILRDTFEPKHGAQYTLKLKIYSWGSMLLVLFITYPLEEDNKCFDTGIYFAQQAFGFAKLCSIIIKYPFLIFGIHVPKLKEFVSQFMIDYIVLGIIVSTFYFPEYINEIIVFGLMIIVSDLIFSHLSSITSLRA